MIGGSLMTREQTTNHTRWYMASPTWLLTSGVLWLGEQGRAQLSDLANLAQDEDDGNMMVT